MKTLSLLLALLLICSSSAIAQIGFNDDGSQPDPSAGLDVKFSDKGLLIPRVALVQTTSASPVTSPVVSLLVFNTATANDVTPGFYFWTGSGWMRIGNVSGSGQLNHIPRWTGPGKLGNSQLYEDNSGNVGIGTTNPGTGMKLDVVGGSIRTEQQLISTVGFGTSPLMVNSTTPVDNLNADMLDGMHASEFALAATSAKSATYRWATFTTYEQCCGWACDNDPNLFGGVWPSNWTDGSAKAYQMSSDKEVLRTVFTQKGYAKNNAMIMNEDYPAYSSTNGKVVMALFRIKNTTGATINWNPSFYYSAYGGWGENASVSLNGGNTWNTTSSGSTSLTIPIPANRVSTVIFVSTSGSTASTGTNFYMRNCRLVFYNNSLLLPDGLEFIDDLDTATGGWDQ